MFLLFDNLTIAYFVCHLHGGMNNKNGQKGFFDQSSGKIIVASYPVRTPFNPSWPGSYNPQYALRSRSRWLTVPIIWRSLSLSWWPGTEDRERVVNCCRRKANGQRILLDYNYLPDNKQIQQIRSPPPPALFGPAFHWEANWKEKRIRSPLKGLTEPHCSSTASAVASLSCVWVSAANLQQFRFLT